MLIVFLAIGLIVGLVLLGMAASEVYDDAKRDGRSYWGEPQYNNTHSALWAYVYDLGFTSTEREKKRKAANAVRAAAAKVKNTERFNAAAQKAVTK